MSKNIRRLAIFGIVWILAACTIGNSGGSPEVTATPVVEALSILDANLILTAKALNAGDTFNTVGQVINYSYDLSNNSPDVSLAGPVVISDDKVPVVCPALNTIGNQNDTFDPAEIITCTGSYTITQADLDAGKVVNVASAKLNGGASTSNVVTVEVPMTPVKVLTLTATADLTTYNQVGQVINLTYVLLNNGTVQLGPTQFTVTDSLIGAPFNCGPADTILQPNGLINCANTHTVTQADLAVASLTSTATATDGVNTTDAVTTVITNNSSASGGFTPGSTVKHTVVKGEWLIQIARCYGANYDSVRKANLNIINPAMILPGQVVSVPNVGSAGKIYGPPCITFHTAVAGDTWASIAAKYNARVDVLQEVNPGGLFNGAQIKVPINSAGGSSSQVPTTVRINIPAGSTTASENGTLAATGKIIYLVAALQGQTMTVALTAPAGSVAMGVYAPAGNTLLNPADLALTWSGILPANGDYRIELSGAAGAIAQTYTLNLAITSP